MDLAQPQQLQDLPRLQQQAAQNVSASVRSVSITGYLESRETLWPQLLFRWSHLWRHVVDTADADDKHQLRLILDVEAAAPLGLPPQPNLVCLLCDANLTA